MKKALYWIANKNFFNRHTIIRKWQCDIFGHHWFHWIRKSSISSKPDYWCAWCARETGKYPKMRRRNDKDFG